MNALEVQRLRELNVQDYGRIRAEYSNWRSKVQFCPNWLIVALAAIFGISAYFFRGPAFIPLLCAALWMLHYISWREGHKDGYIDGYSDGCAEGVYRGLGIIEHDDRRFCEEAATDQSIHELMENK